MNGVGVFLGPILDGAAGNAVNLKRSEKLPQGGSIPPEHCGPKGTQTDPDLFGPSPPTKS